MARSVKSSSPAAGGCPTNLPLQLTSFIGREREIAEIKQLLSDSSPAPPRLMTLTGAGGCGKTRLAIEVAGQYQTIGPFRDGVWLVELASLADAALVPQAVVAALHIREQLGRPLTDTLAEALRSQQLLLVLDNCEHLLDACAQLAEVLLRLAPGLKILATSREALNVTGETVWIVPPLAVPELAALSHHPADPARLLQIESVQLFVDRARAVQSNFTLTRDHAPAVAQICHRLDGIPLAIELAAARLKALSATQIAERLNDRFSLLTSGSRTTLARHQTLRATMDWSYELLAEPERILLQRLSVFAGGWSLDAAEAICGNMDLDEKMRTVPPAPAPPGRKCDHRPPDRQRGRGVFLASR